MKLTTQKVLFETTMGILHKTKSSSMSLGGMEQCLVCGYIADWVTNAHAVTHGYRNRREMADDGKTMSRANHKLVLMRR